jgi:hypothetical protein
MYRLPTSFAHHADAFGLTLVAMIAQNPSTLEISAQLATL